MRKWTRNTHPVSTQHPPRSIHPYSSSHAWFHSEEAVVKEGHFSQELAQGPRLEIVVIRFADLPHPGIR